MIITPREGSLLLMIKCSSRILVLDQHGCQERWWENVDPSHIRSTWTMAERFDDMLIMCVLVPVIHQWRSTKSQVFTPSLIGTFHQLGIPPAMEHINLLCYDGQTVCDELQTD